MTIRLQNLLIIPPIFLVLGLAVGLLADHAAREEILWGLEEEAVALAVTVAEMAGATTLDGVSAADSAAVRGLRYALAQIARFGQAESIMLFSTGAGRAVFALHRDTAAAAEEEGLWSEHLTGPTEHGVVGGVAPWGPYPEALVAAAPVHAYGETRELKGSVAVVIDARRFSGRIRELRRNMLLLVLWVTALGVGAALFLSTNLGRQVRELRDLGAAVAAGEYRVPVKVSGVKEVEDLSNTLGTMASILSDVLTRGRRTILVGDPFQLVQGMASAYRRERMQEAPPLPRVEVSPSLAGKVPAGCFHGWVELPGQTVFWVGEVSGSGSMDGAVEAGAATRALRKELVRGDPQEAVESVARLFRLASLQVAWIEAGPPPSHRFRVLSGSGAPLTKGDYLVIHSFQGQHTDVLAGALALFKDLPAQEAAREFPRALPEALAGVLLLIRTSNPLA